ncbi:sigma-E factor negative regulatory protein [Marinobacter sp. X15-166B]|uniref:sigma-E factor negative regulatory protein n=1 Tax=Marinobacter sp. X15-166B TaxID=1897620 RepID=UPI00085BF3AD|nr:RseA family anti-sigma factor [Marinobacter sp. X15-166B]OEY66902.1 anti-sigma factor [Marinobacter sp. X15-166B]
MDDRLKETLSAMMDDHADELCVRRVLSYSDQAKVREQWQRWQQIRDLMQDGALADPVRDVTRPVREAIDGQGREAPGAPVAAPRPRRHWYWSAVAMIVVGVAAGVGLGVDWQGAGSDAMVAVSGPPAATVVPEVALQGLDEQQWEHLSRYLLEHAQHNSVGAGRGALGYARLASVSGPGD